MREASDIVNCTNNRILDEEMEVVMFGAERLDMDFSKTSIIRKNGHIVSPRQFSTDANFIDFLLVECRRRKIPVTIDARVSTKVTIEDFSMTSPSLMESLVKCILMYLETPCK